MVLPKFEMKKQHFNCPEQWDANLSSIIRLWFRESLYLDNKSVLKGDHNEQIFTQLCDAKIMSFIWHVAENPILANI